MTQLARCLVLLVAASWGCGASPPGDAGIDAPDARDAPVRLDVPRDSPEDSPDAFEPIDAPVDVGDAPLVPRDAWVPTFLPRVYYRNDITCAPLARTYGPVTRRRGAPGEVLWTYTPELDPGPRPRFIELGLGPGMTLWGRIYATPAGGSIAMLGDRGHQLVLSPDGAFVSVVEGFGPYREPARMYLHGEDFLLVDTTRWSMSPFLFILDRDSTGVPAVGMPSEIPTEGPPFLGSPVAEIRQPALLPDGSLVWSPALRTVLRSCNDTGRTAWAMELDHFGYERWFHVAANAAGEVIVNDGATYRISAAGEVLGVRETPEEMIGYSERCGAVLRTFDGFTPVLHYRTGPDFETLVAEVRASSDMRQYFWPTSDCGALEEVVDADGYGVRRYGADGTELFTYHPAARGQIEPIELDDGSLLIVHLGGLFDMFVPAVEIVDPTGALVSRWVLDARVVGESLEPNTAFLTPDGVLYVVGFDDIGVRYRVIAVEIGRAPAIPDMRPNAAITWSRSNETWSLD